jgi:pimeloyl-ACP methyl ester carboxylesterase
LTFNYVKCREIDIHYLVHNEQEKNTLVLLHGLTANAHAFDGLLSHGLAEKLRVISSDLRGRGLSSKPAFGYSLADHAEDILQLLDHLGIEKAWLGGHSYGALLSTYIAVHHPERVAKLVILDAAAEMNPKVLEMLGPSLSRLDTTYPSYEAYIAAMKAAPQNGTWDKDMESYFKADAHVREDGTVNPYPNLANIIEVSMGTANEPWKETFSKVVQPSLLVCALDEYTMGEPLLPCYKAKETAALIPNCEYREVDGNHHTMLYGQNALAVVHLITDFLGVK